MIMFHFYVHLFTSSPPTSTSSTSTSLSANQDCQQLQPQRTGILRINQPQGFACFAARLNHLGALLHKLVARRESGGETAQRLNLFRSLVISIHLDDHFRRQSVCLRLRSHRTRRTTSFWSNRFRTRRIPKRIGRHSMLTSARYGTEFEARVPLTIHGAVLYIDMEVIHIGYAS